MSELMLDFSRVPGHDAELPEVPNNTHGAEVHEPVIETEYRGAHLAEDAVFEDDLSEIRELHERLSKNVVPTINAVQNENNTLEKKAGRYQAISVIAGSIAAGMITVVAMHGIPSEINASALQPEIIIDEKDENNVEIPKAESQSSENEPVAAQEVVVTRNKGEREEVMITIEEGLTLSHLAQGLAVVRGDEALKTHYLSQITTLNPQAAESLSVGDEVFLPSDVVKEEATQIIDEIEEGCEVTPKLGSEAIVTGPASQIRAKIAALAEQCGRTSDVVLQQIQQRNPDLGIASDINYEGEQAVVVPFGQQAVKGGS